MARAYIAIGSNIEPEKNIRAALAALAARCRVRGVSRFYRSRPLNRPEQDDFINGACVVETRESPRDLKFKVLRDIEKALGRVRSADKYAARTIDLDIALYDDQIIEEEDLKIPDPDILERPFLFLPLLDLDNGIEIPGTGQLLSERVCEEVYEGVTVDEEVSAALREHLSKHERSVQSGTRGQVDPATYCGIRRGPGPRRAP